MTRTRIALLTLVVACAAKGTLIGVYYLGHQEWAFRWTVFYDPLATLSAECLAGLLCPQSGLVPNPCQNVVFETWNVLGFGLECMIAVCLLHALLRALRRRGGGVPSAGGD
jgi:hypothetical protein